MAHEEAEHSENETLERVAMDALPASKRKRIVLASGFFVWLGLILLGFGIPVWVTLQSVAVGKADAESKAAKILPIGIATSAVGGILAVIIVCFLARYKPRIFRRAYYQPPHTLRDVVWVIARRLGLVGAVVYCLSVIGTVPELEKLWQQDGFRSIGWALICLCGVAIIVSCFCVGYKGIVDFVWKWAGLRCPKQCNRSPSQSETTG